MQLSRIVVAFGKLGSHVILGVAIVITAASQPGRAIGQQVETPPNRNPKDGSTNVQQPQDLRRASEIAAMSTRLGRRSQLLVAEFIDKEPLQLVHELEADLADPALIVSSDVMVSQVDQRAQIASLIALGPDMHHPSATLFHLRETALVATFDGTEAPFAKDTVLSRDGDELTLRVITRVSHSIDRLAGLRTSVAGLSVEQIVRLTTTDADALLELAASLGTAVHDARETALAVTSLLETLVVDFRVETTVRNAEGASITFSPDEMKMSEATAALGVCVGCYSSCLGECLGSPLQVLCTIAGTIACQIFPFPGSLGCSMGVCNACSLGDCCALNLVRCFLDCLRDPSGLIADCEGNCIPETDLLKPGCNPALDCAEYNCDNGDCVDHKHPCPDYVVVAAPYTSPTRSISCVDVFNDDCNVPGYLDQLDDDIYKVWVPQPGNWTFSLCGATFDTLLTVGTTECGTEVGINDDFCGSRSQVSATIPAGEYWVTVDAFCLPLFCACGEYVLEIYREPVVDYQATAPFSFSGVTCGAVDDCDVQFSDNEDHVYLVTIPSAGQWRFSLCESSYDTKVQIGTSLCSTNVGYNDNLCGLRSQITTSLSGGQYFVTVDGWNNECGAYELNVFRPVVDDARVAPFTHSSNTCGEGNDCSLRLSQDRTYQVTIPSSGSWTFSLCGANFDTYMYLTASNCEDVIEFNDDDCGLGSRFTTFLQPGTYSLTIEASSSGDCGSYTLEVFRCGDGVCNGQETFETCPQDCDPPPGACCLLPGCTMVMDQAECVQLDGKWQGPGTTCGGVMCRDCQNNQQCDDGDPCNGVETCVDGTCASGAPLDCNDGNPCTDDGCIAFVGCDNPPNTVPCDDGNPCTKGDTCSNGNCVPGSPLKCDDGDACTVDECVFGSCTNRMIDCDDENPCTIDECIDGRCTSQPMDCSDGNPCTVDTCTSGICLNQPADVDGDGVVGTADLLRVLAGWGDCQGCSEDLDGDGLVGQFEVDAIIFEYWGAEGCRPGG